jgi:adenylate kinase family enzyme
MNRKIGKAEDRTKEAVDALKRRVNTFKEQTAPVVEMYNRFGKVSFISGEGEVNEIYAETRKAIFPQVSFLVGP